MKHKVFFYLFLFSIVIIALLFNSNRNMLNSEEKKVSVLHKRIEILRDSLHMTSKDNDADYFSLDYNDDAQEYFDFQNMDSDIKKIREEILTLNHQENGNPLVPYGVIDGQKCIIDKMKFINHRWIIADFYAGAIHGEVLIKYFFSKEEPTQFSTIETVLYPSR
ncbi:hypothetical protein C8P70_10566 [Myroides indicus]|uniref:Hydrolase n=2 Tax=Myroides indicus TaxID=1323422 RepID=A0A4R7F627_9FLAO|nr:hypothetical protein C8P70_10566 [Myroides indicus]